MAGDNQFDLVILGGGSGGYACAFRAADLGMRVVLIEKAEVGGTCLHRGCIPTKALLHAGEVADNTREAAQFGVAATFQGIDMAGVNTYKDGVVGQLYKGLQGIVKARKIEFIAGEGRLVVAEHRRQVERRERDRRERGAGDRLGAEVAARPGDRRQPDHLQRPRAEAGPRPGLGDHPRRRRHRLRVRLGLEVLRHRRDHHRGRCRTWSRWRTRTPPSCWSAPSAAAASSTSSATSSPAWSTPRTACAPRSPTARPSRPS